MSALEQDLIADLGAGRWNSQYDEQQTDSESATSGLSTLNKDRIAERGARMARRDD
jgi:hypothetical protein